uniref:Uncharacterized protein n=1 Tax=Oryza glumipatula TaxID=40148 RepID=A0A0D9YCE2_9ORYZ
MKPSAALEPVSDTPAQTSMTNDSCLLPMSRDAMASSIPEKSSMTPSIPIGNCPRIVTNELPNTSPSASLPMARNTTDAPLRPPNRYCPASPPAPWQHGMAPNQHPTKFMSPTLTDTRAGESSARSGNRSDDSLHTAITEFSTDSGSCGTAPSQNPILKSSQVILTSPNGAGPKRRSCRMDGSRTKQSTKPSANTISAAGTRLQERRRRLVPSLLTSSSSPEPGARIMNSSAASARTRPSRPRRGRGTEVEAEEEREKSCT